jgi:hypothetical protein
MNRHLQDVLLILFIAAFHFGGAYFAASALVPAVALQVALIALLLAMSGYLLLSLMGNDQGGLPMGLLITWPVTYFAMGLLWSLMRLVGLWPPPF